MKFIHSADWQLGARFAQFGAQSETLRQARLSTLRKALQAARDRLVDAFVIAGDLFEDNQVEDALVAQVLQLFGEFASVPIFILPGNHDPHTGPDSLWSRTPFATPPANVKVFLTPEIVSHAGGYFLPSPLTQKVSTVDPTLRLVEMASTLPANALKIGVAHGALAIPGKHQPHDFPIDLSAASRAGLDYLAIGHWHNWQTYDAGRLVMPGTPEPDQFDQTDCGCVALVEITAPHAAPSIEKLPVATLRWESLQFDFLGAEDSRRTLQQNLAALHARAGQTIIRVTLHGQATPALLEETRQWLESLLAPFLVGQTEDESTIAFAPAELAQLQQDHPLLGQVLTDLAQLEHLIANTPPPDHPPTAEVFSLPAAQQLLADARIDLTVLGSAHFNLARQILFQKLREVGA